MRRFGHGHSLALGVLLTLAFERHALLAVLLVFVAGVIAGRLSLRIRRGAQAVTDRAAELHRAKLADLRASRMVKLSRAWESRREVKRAYIQGAIDAGKEKPWN